MSISRALGAEKPAAKRRRSYMEGPCGRKLSIMSTVLPNTPSQKSKAQMLAFLRGHARQNKGAHRKSKLQNVEENVCGRMLPVAASPKKGGGARARARACAPPTFSRGVPSARAGVFLYIYLSISTYLSRYLTYIYIHIYLSLSLSLFLSMSSFWRRLRRAHVCTTKLQ